MKIVKKAKIEIVTLPQLRENDEILWSNLRCKILRIDRWNRKVTFIPSSLPDYDNPFEGSYMHYYRILDCEERSVCTFCGRVIENGDICEECKKVGERSNERNY